ncbi:MAG: protein kinase [Proteobacteria bacterium]|nr:protein kinase [Pseudomonadota bacterium]
MIELVDPILPPGELVGEYQVVERIAGTQYRARHASGTSVVLDVRPRADFRLVAVQLMRAASTLEVLSHPGIARIVAHGVRPDHRPWAASELVDGDTLSDLMMRRPLGEVELASILRDLAEVLAFAHAHDVVHGALRPHQIVIPTGARRFAVSIGDWTWLRAPNIPTFGDPPAPDAYVAPEHLHGAIDGRADVYALGVIAYRALSGALPGEAEVVHFDGDTELGQLVVDMLEAEPRYRVTMADVHRRLVELTSDEDHVITSAKLPRPRWTPPPPELGAHARVVVAQVDRKRAAPKKV